LLELPDAIIRTSYLLVPESPQQLSRLNSRVDDYLNNYKKYGIAEQDARFVRLYTFNGLVKRLRESLGFLYTFLAIADILVIGAVALMSGFLANIYFEQRLGEFGLLSAFGFRRERLARRVIIETGMLVIAGWLLGLLLTWLIFSVLDTYYMIPRGLILAQIDRLAIGYTLPTPIIVGLASLGTVLFRLYRMDPIEIMERR
jgi:ABC-type antimicrobial peptide transport system permease subunit